MKKTILILGWMATIIITANAQLIVNSNGNVRIGTSSTRSSLTLNCAEDTSTILKFNGTGKVGINGTVTGETIGSHLSMTSLPDCDYSMNLWVSHSGSQMTSNVSRGIGILGSSSGAKFNFGVLGVGMNSRPGAGIVGTHQIVNPPTSLFDKFYAGFFYGDVKTTGNMTVNGSIQGTLLASTPSASNSQETNVQRLSNNTSMADLISNLDAISYQYIYPEITRSPEELDIPDFLEGKEMSEYLEHIDDEDKDIIKEQIKSKKHFGFDADQLELLFPDLVYEKEDGSKAINYMEMIPLLVQSIKELKAELNEVKGTDGNARKAPQTNDVSNPTTKQARLYQNTPNPFTAQTEIRFSLPDDATNACICIFDMTGKLLKKLPISSNMSSITVNGYELGEGIYLYSLVVNGLEIDTKRMLITK